MVGCHWQEIPEARRQQLVAEYEVAAGALPTTRAEQQAGPVHETHMQAEADEEETTEIRFED